MIKPMHARWRFARAFCLRFQCPFIIFLNTNESTVL